MRILFDHGTPAPLESFFTDHSIYKAKDLGWDTLSNGELLKVAEEAGFHVSLTTDKNKILHCGCGPSQPNMANAEPLC